MREKRARIPQLEVLEWLKEHHPGLHANAEIDREWIGLVTNLSGEGNPATRESIKEFGFIFSRHGGHKLLGAARPRPKSWASSLARESCGRLAPPCQKRRSAPKKGGFGTALCDRRRNLAQIAGFSPFALQWESWLWGPSCLKPLPFRRQACRVADLPPLPRAKARLRPARRRPSRQALEIRPPAGLESRHTVPRGRIRVRLRHGQSPAHSCAQAGLAALPPSPLPWASGACALWRTRRRPMGGGRMVCCSVPRVAARLRSLLRFAAEGRSSGPCPGLFSAAPLGQENARFAREMGGRLRRRWAIGWVVLATTTSWKRSNRPMAATPTACARGSCQSPRRQGDEGPG